MTPKRSQQLNPKEGKTNIHEERQYVQPQVILDNKTNNVQVLKMRQLATFPNMCIQLCIIHH